VEEDVSKTGALSQSTQRGEIFNIDERLSDGMQGRVRVGNPGKKNDVDRSMSAHVGWGGL